MSTVPGQERTRLRFREVVVEAFSFLSALDFHCTQAAPTLVRFESDKVFVNVYHGRSSFEIDVEIGTIAFDPGAAGQGYRLADLRALQGHPEHRAPALSASTPEAVADLVPKVAAMTREWGAQLLKGDSAAFDKVAALRSQRSQHLMREIELVDARKTGERAWHAKDYASFVAAYEGFAPDDLKPSERKRLAYARKRLRG